MLVLYIYIQSRVTTSFIPDHFTQVVQPRLSSPSQEKKSITMERKLQIILTLSILCQTIKMDIEPCANSMWMEGVIRDCYAGQAEKIEGLTRLSLWMMLEKLRVSKLLPMSAQRI